MSTIDKYAKMVTSRWGSGEFSQKTLGRPDPFSVLSDRTRTSITVLLSLKGPLTAQQIAGELDLSPSTILSHIEKLHDAMIIREVQVAEKQYKRERYYDVDIVPYFDKEEKEIEERIKKYADILNETARAVFEKCLDELSDLLKETTMARHWNPLERDDVKHFIFLKLMHNIESYLSEKSIYQYPLKTERRWNLFIRLVEKKNHKIEKKS